MPGKHETRPTMGAGFSTGRHEPLPLWRRYVAAPPTVVSTLVPNGAFLASGELVRVLEDWCPPFPGFFLYYPRQRQLPAALAALIETLRLGGVPQRAARG